ncbi:Sarcosine oxidase gamma subunit (fragment) [Mesorhizobium plurifarium]|uniref:Sarcosine oxidase gamma subunit n=1 Tax=Mesorhizobium plurifarium TaxID=69974 RepID=A0A090F1M5_MESPL
MRFDLSRAEGGRVGPVVACSIAASSLRVIPPPAPRAGIAASRPRTFDILKACVAIDWDSPQAKPGSVLQTGFHHVPVLLLRTAADACDILAPRSFAQSLVAWLTDIAAPEIFEVK